MACAAPGTWPGCPSCASSSRSPQRSSTCSSSPATRPATCRRRAGSSLSPTGASEQRRTRAASLPASRRRRRTSRGQLGAGFFRTDVGRCAAIVVVEVRDPPPAVTDARLLLGAQREVVLEYVLA